MDKLKRKRTVIRGAATKIKNALAEVTEPSEKHAKAASLNTLAKDLKDLDEKIMDLMIEDDHFTEEECEKELLNNIEIQNSIAGLLCPTEEPKTELETTRKLNMQLPKLQLDKFELSPKNYMAWWTQFSTINESNITSDVKLQYLKTTLVGTAKSLIESFPNTEDSYYRVIDILKNRYGREDLIVGEIYRELLLLVRNKPFIVELYDKVNSKIQNLEALGITAEKASILVPLIEECLPEESRRLWERRDRCDAKERHLLYILMEFLAKEAECAERMGNAWTSGFEKRPVSTAAALVSTSSIKQQKFNSYHSSNNYKSGKICCFCSGSHFSKDCNVIMDSVKRREIVKEKRLCYACLRFGHSIGQCRTRVDCSKCKGRHYVLLCTKVDQLEPNNSNVAATTASASPCMFAGPNNCVVILQTMIVLVKGKRVRVILDSASHRSYVSSALADSLNLPKVSVERFKHLLFGGTVSDNMEHDVHSLTLKSIDGTKEFSLLALKQPDICGVLPNSYKRVNKELLEAGIEFFDDPNLPIDILLGADVMGRFVVGVKSVGDLLAFKTQVGWCLLGTIPNSSASLVNVSWSMLSTKLPDLWDLEVLGITDSPIAKNDHESCNKFFDENIVFDNGKYLVALPWKEDHPPLTNNRDVAVTRLSQVLRRLELNELYGAYDKVFHEWEKAGIIERVEDDENEQCFYLPHRPVVKHSKTTKVRPVFDASWKWFDTPSLNDCLHVGENILGKLFVILILFRRGKIGCIADIKQAFCMIGLRFESDKDMLRFLWQRFGKIITFRHCRVPFGLSPSPYLLNATLRHHFNLEQFKDNAIVAKLRDGMYVDDCVSSEDSRIEAELFKEEACKVLALGNFELRGWIFTGDEGDHHVLGTRWLSESDLFGCCSPKIDNDMILTKRSLLSVVGRIYDPLGLIAAPILSLKLVLQETFRRKLSWDELLPDDLRNIALRWISEIPLIDSILIPRWYGGKGSLHIFSDASKDGMACCCFMRIELDTKVILSFVCSKARVSPLGDMSIPRKELVAALMASRLGNSLCKALFVTDVTYWCDAMIVLHWIRNNERSPIFVGNRIKEIRELTEVSQWRFVPGQINPADVVSRGCFLSDYISWKWLDGPSWLTSSKEFWPEVAMDDNPSAVVSPVLSNVCVKDYEDFCRFRVTSSFSKNIRILGYALRFVDILMKRGNLLRGPLTSEENERAEKLMIQLLQRLLSGLILTKYDTFQDADGMYRVKTKILSDQFLAEFKTPIVLPKCEFVGDLIREIHYDNHHAGVGITVGLIREKFWIVQARSLARKIIQRCTICRWFRAHPFVTPPIGLPNSRVELGNVFDISGCDLAGPLFTQDNNKVWIVLFTCAVYRAVHFELVDTLTTECFLMAMRRFIARRGKVQKLISDNGTNFVGAWNLIKRVEIEEQFKIKWIFNPPGAPWWGGFFERLIRSLKDILRASLGNALLSRTELYTVIVEAEALINSRPLTYLTNEPNELLPISPSYFLKDNFTAGTPDLDLVDENSLTSRVQYVHKCRESLKERFKKEYLGNLLLNKARNVSRSIKVGEVVIVASDKKRIDWKLGRVLETFLGKDGIVRTVRLKVQSGELIRPVQCLVPLEVGYEEKPEPYAKDDFVNPERGDENVTVRPDCELDTVDLEFNSNNDVTRSGRMVKPPLRCDL